MNGTPGWWLMVAPAWPANGMVWVRSVLCDTLPQRS